MIYINNIEMPKTCNRCFACQSDNVGFIHCGILGDIVGRSIKEEIIRPEKCPLKEKSEM